MTDAVPPPDDTPAPTATMPTGPLDPPEWDEELYLAASAVLLEADEPATAAGGLGCLVISLALFALAFVSAVGVRTLSVLIPVLFIHEAGHFVGMRLFGYRNLRMFFIPFFGAAVSGRKHAAPAWQQVVVLLLGPLPGLVLAVALEYAFAPPRDTYLGEFVLWLVVLNAFNLLPVVPLDGGRVLDVLLFARSPWMAVGFRVMAVVAMGALAWVESSVVVAFLATIMALGTRSRYRQARIERAFRHNPMGLPERLEDLTDFQRRDLFGWAMYLSPLNRAPVGLAQDMRTLHEHMVSRRAGVGATLGFLVLYFAGFGLAVEAQRTHRAHEEARASVRSAEAFEALKRKLRGE